MNHEEIDLAGIEEAFEGLGLRIISFGVRGGVLIEQNERFPMTVATCTKYKNIVRSLYIPFSNLSKFYDLYASTGQVLEFSKEELDQAFEKYTFEWTSTLSETEILHTGIILDEIMIDCVLTKEPIEYYPYNTIRNKDD